MTPTALSIISTTFPDGPERNKALGVWGMMGGIGATAGWLIGGPLVDGRRWEWIFFISIPFGLAALALPPMLVRESRGAMTRRSYDPAGAATSTGALVLLVYAVVEGPDVGWGDVQTILLFAGSALLLAGFALIGSLHRAPLVPLRILRSRTLVGANLVMLLFGTVAFGMPFILSLYAQQVLGYSALEFGVGTAVVTVAAAVGSIVGQAAALKLGFTAVAATGMTLMAAGSLLLTQVTVGGSYFGDIFIGLLVFGLGIGLAFVTATVAALAGVAERQSGVASGLSNTALQIGQALGVAIVTTVAVSGSEDYLTANDGANPLVVVTEASSPPSWPASCWPGSAWRWRSCSWVGRGRHRTSGWSRSRRPAPRTEERTLVDRSEEIVDYPDGWVAEHMRAYVATDGRRGHDSTAGTPSSSLRGDRP